MIEWSRAEPRLRLTSYSVGATLIAGREVDATSTVHRVLHLGLVAVAH
jgi:hypothetical protein